MKAETIAVGTELLIGQIANTNAQYLSEKLNGLGLNVYYHTVVGDNEQRVIETLKTAVNRSDYIFITGGLGPTEDDLTREAIANFANVELVEDPITKQKIEQFFKNRNINMPKNNLKQALFPKEATILENDCGTAPGFIIKVKNSHLVVLPGPPNEMQHIFEAQVLPKLFSQITSSICSKYIKIFGIGESIIEDRLLDLIDTQTSPTIATYAKDGEVTIRLTGVSKTADCPDSVFEPVLSEISKRFGRNVFSTENEEMQAVTAMLLRKHKITISTAESCTGGLLSQKLTSIPGISSVFIAGYITYSNQAKMKLLNVKPETLNAFGAVSKETAMEMAEGARISSDSHIGISITGIAGPDGGTATKPVGLVYVGFSSKTENTYKELHLSGSRERIRNLTSLHALDMIRQYLLDSFEKTI